MIKVKNNAPFGFYIGREVPINFVMFFQAFTPDNDDNGPVDSPHTLVKRQLRSRNIKIRH